MNNPQRCPHLRQTLAGSNQHQGLVTCLDCNRRLLLVHGRVDRTLAERAVAIVDPNWGLTQQRTTGTRSRPAMETSAPSNTMATTTISIQQTFAGQRETPPAQRTVATQTEPESDR